MILAEKITMLRKQNGWSQEELAMKLDISRQSVSKWESTASVPDLDKIIKLSQIFGVSTDFLLKDELEIEETMIPAGADSLETPKRKVSVEEANVFMNLTETVAVWIASGVMLCILSLIPLLALSGLGEYGLIPLSEDAGAGLGMIFLFVMVGIAVAIFILKGMQLTPFEYLEKEEFTLEYGIYGIVEKKKQEFEHTFRACITIGVLLCIFSVIPLFLTELFPDSELLEVWSICILLIMVACGVFLFVWAGMIHGSYQKLLQEEDYSGEMKHTNKKIEAISGAYWCLITAIFLAYSFLTKDWGRSWIIWPCAGVLYAAICCVLHVIYGEKS